MYCNICTGEEGKTVLVRAAKTFKQAGESGHDIADLAPDHVVGLVHKGLQELETVHSGRFAGRDQTE